MESSCSSAQFQGHMQEQILGISRREHEQRMSLAKALVDMLGAERDSRAKEGMELRMAIGMKGPANGEGGAAPAPGPGADGGQELVGRVVAAAAAEVHRIARDTRTEWEALNGELRGLCGRLAEDLSEQCAKAAAAGVIPARPQGEDRELPAVAKLRRTAAEMQ